MKRLLLGVMSAVVLLSSCAKKIEEEPKGEAHVRFVNAVSGSADQDVYLNSVKLANATVGFGKRSNYFSYTSGINSFDFANTGTVTSNALINYGVAIGDWSTVFYYSNSFGLPVAGAIKDDMTTPPAGKARVRFINLNYQVTSTVKVMSGGVELVPVVSFGYASAYYNVDPGAKFTPQAVSVTTAPEMDFGIQAGKIYTIMLHGATATELYGYNFPQN